jgi:hypothetical protein
MRLKTVFSIDLRTIHVERSSKSTINYKIYLVYYAFVIRTQKCKVNACFFNILPVSAGVPQGKFNSTNVELYLYADDTAIVFSGNNDIELQDIINDFVSKYSVWCNANCIVINPVKSNFLSFNCAVIYVSINGHNLDNPHVVTYLGIQIDDKLSWNSHVKYVIKSCSQRVGVFKKVLPYLTPNTALLYYNAFIRSCFIALCSGSITFIHAGKRL